MRYMIAPLDLTEQQFHVYKMLYKRMDFKTFIVQYSNEQLLADSDPIFKLTSRKIRTILKHFIERNMISIHKQGRKGFPTIYKITNMSELLRHESDMNTTQKRHESDMNDAVIPTPTEVERHESDINTTQKRHESDNPIKDKDKDKDILKPSCIDKPIRYDESHEYYLMASYLRKKVLEVNPKCRVPKLDPVSMDKWSDDFRKMQKIDKRSTEEIRNIVSFIYTQDNFWSGVVQSPSNLRKNWDKITGKMITRKPKTTQQKIGDAINDPNSVVNQFLNS